MCCSVCAVAMNQLSILTDARCRSSLFLLSSSPPPPPLFLLLSSSSPPPLFLLISSFSCPAGWDGGHGGGVSHRGSCGPSLHGKLNGLYDVLYWSIWLLIFYPNKPIHKEREIVRVILTHLSPHTNYSQGTFLDLHRLQKTIHLPPQQGHGGGGKVRG